MAAVTVAGITVVDITADIAANRQRGGFGPLIARR